MKKIICLAASLLALNFAPVFGQPAPPATILPQPPTTFSQHVAGISAQAEAGQVNAAALTKFNLDFPGGTPKELVAAIEKAMGKPLNAIIPTEDAGVDLPPLKMSDVDVARLFKALELASMKKVAVVTSTYGGANSSYSTYTLSYGFMTDGQPFPSDNSVWYFHADKPIVPLKDPLQKVCQFYTLTPYLNNGYTVDDITTAIQTGWKMAGEVSPPELNYHKETGLLIAFGDPVKLKIISDVLTTLPALQPQYWQQTDKNIYQLQQQVIKLQAKVDVLSANASPAEKSGK